MNFLDRIENALANAAVEAMEQENRMAARMRRKAEMSLKVYRASEGKWYDHGKAGGGEVNILKLIPKRQLFKQFFISLWRKNKQ